MYFIEMFEESFEYIFEHIRDLFVIFVDYIQQIVKYNDLLLFLDDGEDNCSKGDEVVMLVYSVEAANQYQLLRLTDVLRIDAEINSLAVLYEIFGHYRRDDSELVGEIYITRFDFIDIYKFRASFDGNKVHVEHFLLKYTVPSLHHLEGM